MRLAIRCAPRTPVCVPDIESWLDRELDEFRDHNGQAATRLSRLTQAPSNGESTVGWLIELELGRDSPADASEDIAAMLGDLRLLGLQPAVLVTPDGGARPSS